MTQIQNVLSNDKALACLRMGNNPTGYQFREAFRKPYFGKRGPLGRFAVVKAWIYFGLPAAVRDAVL